MYIFLYLLTPFINKLINSLTQKEHRSLIITLFTMLSLIPHLVLHNTLPNSGYTIANFVMLYIIGAYFGKYKLKNNIHFKNYSKHKYQLIIFILLILSMISSFVIKPLSGYFKTFDSTFLNYISNMLGYNTVNFSSPFIIIESILYLLFFETLTIKSKFINNLSKLVFGIYLVHENKFVYSYFLYEWLPIGTSGFVSSYRVVVDMLLISILIFIISAIIELIRQKLFKVFGKLKPIKNLKFFVKKYIHEF